MYRRRWLIESSTREQRSSKDPNTTSHTMYELSIQVAQGRSNNESCLSLIHLTATTGFEHIFHCSEFPRSGWITLITHHVLFGGPSLGEAAMWRRYPVSMGEKYDPSCHSDLPPSVEFLSMVHLGVQASSPTTISNPHFLLPPASRSLLCSPVHIRLSRTPEDASNEQREGNKC